jgi:hypothetical protein
MMRAVHVMPTVYVLCMYFVRVVREILA